MTRRARVTPERVGIAPGTDRRVPGLRSNWTRPSVGTYSTWREPGPAVRSCGGAPAARRPSPCVPACRPHWTRSQWARRSSAMDAWTCWAQTFSAERSTTTCTPRASRPPNLARFCFLAESARSFYPDWNTAADVTVAILRAEAGSDPHDKDLHDLVGELSTRSDAFRAKWAAHNVRRHGTGTKTFVHPVRWRGAPGVRGPRSHRGPRTAVPDLHRPTRHRRRRTPRPTRQLGGDPGLGRTSSGTLDQRLAGVRLNTR